MIPIRQTLHDQEGDKTLDATIETTTLGIELRFTGYGDCATEGCGCPIFVEFYEGKLWLRVWADINQEDPTHCIDMSGALITNRKNGANDDINNPTT
jgi:hypothetical protein